MRCRAATRSASAARSRQCHHHTARRLVQRAGDGRFASGCAQRGAPRAFGRMARECHEPGCQGKEPRGTLAMKSLLHAVLAVVVSLAPSFAGAQEPWASKPVKLVVPSSPGGGTDVFARLLAQALTDSMNQQFVVENRPGASGTVGAQAVATAPRDGYTFLVAANASIAINPAFNMKLAYNVETDLAPVARGVMAVSALIVNPDTGIKDIDDLVARAKKQPEALAFGSAGDRAPPLLWGRVVGEAGGARILPPALQQDCAAGPAHTPAPGPA